MKKILLVVLMLFTIVGCSCKKDEKVILNVETMPKEKDVSPYLYLEYKLLSKELKTTDNYDDKIANKDSFLLFVYAEGCYGCSLLSPALREYVNENEVAIYTLDYAKVSDKHDLYKAGVNTTPYLVLVENGRIRQVKLVKLTNDEKSNIEWVKKWMSKYVEWRKI